MTAPIFDKDVPHISRSLNADNDRGRVAPPRDPPGKDFKKLLQEQEKPRKDEKKRPFSDVAAGYKKAAEKKDSELEDYSAGEAPTESESPTGYPTDSSKVKQPLPESPRKSSDQNRKDTLGTPDSSLNKESISQSSDEDYVKSFFGEEPKSDLSATSESPVESVSPESDIASLLAKRHDSLEKKSNVSLFDLQAQSKASKSSEHEMHKLENPYQSSFTSSLSPKKENKTAAEQTAAAKEGQAVSFTAEEPSAKRIKTGLEAALEAKRQQEANSAEDANLANSKVERKNPRLPMQEGDKNSAALLAAQSAAGDQHKLANSSSSSAAPVSASQDPRVKELIEKIMDNLYTVSVDGETDTSFEIKDPNSVFNGAKIVISVNDKEPDQFSVTIERLSVLAKNLVEMHGHQDALRSAFEQKGLTLHTIYATTGTLRDEVPRLAKSDESTRDQKGDEGNRQDGRQKRQQQHS